MIAIAFVDDRGGMRFAGRRQSRDRLALADLLELCAGRTLWAAPCSAELFARQPERLRTAENFLERAGAGEYCLLEDRPLPADGRLEGLILYRWNRLYPADLRLGDLPAWLVLRERTEFPGSSHARITREIYGRRADND